MRQRGETGNMNNQKVKCRGRVVSSLGHGKFKIELMCVASPSFNEDGANIKGIEVNGYISGKMKQNNITVLVGDEVTIEVQLPNIERGRIVYRHKKPVGFAEGD